MCLLCSGVFCCVPLKPLSVCWPSMAQVNGKELSKSDHEDTMEAFRTAEEPIIVEVLRRTSNVTSDLHGTYKVTATVRPNVVPDVMGCGFGHSVGNDGAAPAIKHSLLTGRPGLAILPNLSCENKLLDCGGTCCLMSKQTSDVSVYGHSEAIVKSVCEMDCQRELDLGYKAQDGALKTTRKNCQSPRDILWATELKEDPERMTIAREDFMQKQHNGILLVDGDVPDVARVEYCTVPIEAPCELCIGANCGSVISHGDLNEDQTLNASTLVSNSCASIGDRRRGAVMLREDMPTLDAISSGATLRRSFRKSRRSMRSELAGSRDTVSEVNCDVSRHISPILRRKNRCASGSAASTSWRSRDVAQTTDPRGSGDVLVVAESSIFGDVSGVIRRDCGVSGCDATTQTEWRNGWEPLPSGFLSLFRTRIQQTPPTQGKNYSNNDKRDSGCSTPEQQGNMMSTCDPLTAVHYRHEVVPDPNLFRLGERSFLQVDKSTGSFGSMDNMGFLSSGESSDQARTMTTTTTARPQYRAKDDWALCKTSRTEEHVNALPRYQSDTSLDREMAQLSQEMANIQLECEVLVSRHLNERMKMSGSQVSSTSPPPLLSQLQSQHQLQTQQQARPPSLQCDLPSVHVSRKDFLQPPLPPPLPSPLLQTQNPPPNKIASGGGRTDDTVTNWVRSSAYLHHQRRNSRKSSSEEEEDEDEEDKDSSSAYNTGESSGSTAMGGNAGSNTSGDFQKSLMTLIVEKMSRSQEEDKEEQSDEEQTCERVQCMCSTDETKDHCKDDELDDPFMDAPEEEAPPISKEQFQPTFSPGTIMYTNEAHLHHTIWLQQQLLRRALALSGGTCGSYDEDDQQKSSALHHPDFQGSRYGSCQEDDSSPSKTPEMEWRVKRRPDGTRYITRRPSRTKILKERALRISEERRGLTTDDDATSEMKLGRYWSKEERKRHLERARERRRKEGGGRSKLAVVREGRRSLVVVQEEEPLVSPGGRRSTSGKYSPLHPALTKMSHCSKLARTSALLSVTTV